MVPDFISLITLQQLNIVIAADVKFFCISVDTVFQSTMDRLRVYFVFVVIATVEWLGVCENPASPPGFQIYIKNIHCNASERYIHNLTCFAKSYSRNVSTLTIHVHSKQPITSAFVSLLEFGSVSEVFNEVFRSKSNFPTNTECFSAKF